MKILLLGAKGQVGAQIERLSNILGYQTAAFSKQELDITDYLKVRKKIDEIKPEIVINTAAYHVVASCEKYPNKAFEVNASAVKNLAFLCSQRKVRLVHFSTSWVFDGYMGRPYREDDLFNPLQTYGLSKLAGEIAALNYNADTIIIRTCGVFGGLKGSRAKKGNFILHILNQARLKKSLEVSAEQTTSITNAEDLALATLKLVQKKAARGIYHLVNKGYCSWSELAQQIVNLKNLDLKIVSVDRKGVFQEVRVPIISTLENTRAKSLGIILPHWREALARYLTTLP